MEPTNKDSTEGASYRNILKSTSLIGGSSVINIIISMVRIKFVAILLGPTGVGLLGLYTQITTVIISATDMGLSNSGVRQVAEAVGTKDNEQIARTVISLRRMAWLTGVFGALVMAVFSVPISRISFNTDDHAVSIAVLGASLLLISITAGQSCVLRGTRRIVDVAKITVISAFWGTLISIPCFYIWGVRGIVPSLILSAIAALLVSWWYARKVTIVNVVITWWESFREARSLLSLGLSFMGAGLVGSLTVYLIQVALVRQFSLAGFGIYQAAFSLSGVLVGFVLSAMGADYYPRLTAVAGDNVIVHRMVNEQSQVSLLLALPCLVAMSIFSPFIIQLLYTTSFAPAVPVLRWCILGILGRVLSWPLGFVLLAQGRGRLFFITEILACAFHLAAVLIFTRVWGLEGAGIAFMTLYVAYTGLMLCIMRRLVGKTWTRSTFRLSLVSATIMGFVTFSCTFNSQYIIVWILNIVALVMVSFFCFRTLAIKSETTLKTLLGKLNPRKLVG